MAVKAKTLVNDVGSAALEEVAAQLNTAMGSTGPFSVTPFKGDDGGAINWSADNKQNYGFLYHAVEDCLITSIKIASAVTNLGANTTSEIVVMHLASDFKQGDDSTAGTFAEINGSGDIALGTGTGANLVYVSASATADNTLTGWVELIGKTATGSSVGADVFNGVLGSDHAATPIQDGLASVAMAAGDSLIIALDNRAGGAVTLFANVSYRPVKDSLTLSPSFKQSARNFKSTDR